MIRKDYMNCKYKKIRTKKGIKYGYCTLNKKEVNLFNCRCESIEMKNISTKKKKPLKSSKITKLERDRYSILTNNLKVCIECGKNKDNIHEIYEGAYRNRSMIFGLCIPLCYECHKKIHSDYDFKIKYKQLGEKTFKEHYPNLNFNEYFYYKRKD